ncbi:MAG: hypothetical protein E5Y01_14650 [Mesorhizobium sp.]|uniref:hypothetical protein n=1 Tax=Mesorhizobium sp. TaxID=1871066 RepID=UPI0011FB9951|nr:hypothetical protein [Mesorhizobium sp.]TJV51492.1 MAG: hypothetical protein E5Y01_14650 [Mesorhizobium sp.]
MSTLKIALPLVVVLLGSAVVTTATEAVAAEGPYSTPVIRAAFGCQFSDGQLICGNLKKHGHAQGTNEDDGSVGEPPCRPGGAAGLTRFGMPCDVRAGQKGKKKKKDVDVGSEGERSCPPGYVVLKEKNKYGAFCEPKEGFPAQEPAPETKAANTTGYKCDVDAEPPAFHVQYTMSPSQVANKGEAQALFAQHLKDNHYIAKGPVSCTPVQYK